MKRNLQTLLLGLLLLFFMSGCAPPSPEKTINLLHKYEITLLDGTVVVYVGDCIHRVDVNLVVYCKKVIQYPDRPLYETQPYWMRPDVYVATEVHTVP